jgi:hypothetical protein
MTAYEMPTVTGSTSSKAASGLGSQVLVKTTKPKTVQQVYDNTRMFFSRLVLLSQNVTIPTTGGEADGPTPAGRCGSLYFLCLSIWRIFSLPSCAFGGVRSF